jgi:N-acyl homoserine lactone hydrolase
MAYKIEYTKPSRLILYFAILLLVLFINSFRSSPLPKPAPYSGSLPTASPPAEMAIFHFPTGSNHRSALFGYRGGSYFDKREFAMTAVLVKHPKGDVLIDTGFGSQIDAQFAQMPLMFRMGTSYEKGIPAAEQLKKSGYDIKKLSSILITHAHWDHVSGLTDFPNIPVLINADEKNFIQTGGAWVEVARSLANIDYKQYSFEDKPYLSFEKSYDFYGDGSLVIVSAPGHTPGSIIVFLNLPNGRRYALLGDLVWQREGISLLEEKPWLMRRSADSDAEKVRENILKIAAISAKFPEIILVPAHDERGFAEIPKG